VSENAYLLSELLRANPSLETPLLFFILVSLSMFFYGVGALTFGLVMKASANR
jgi:hypothetical protein